MRTNLNTAIIDVQQHTASVIANISLLMFLKFNQAYEFMVNFFFFLLTAFAVGAII